MIDNNQPLTDEEEEKASFSSSYLFDDLDVAQPDTTTRQAPTPPTSSSYLYDDIITDPTYIPKKEDTPASPLYDDPPSSFQPSNKYSQTEWEAQPEFQKTWNRFANKIGEDDDFYEYMRDADWNLGSAAFRAIESGKWDDKTKQDYLYLKNAYDNTEIKGAKEWTQFFKNASWDVITDPANAIALLFAIPTLGTSGAIRAAAGEASKAAIKKYTLANIGEATLSSTAKKAAIIEGMKRPAIYGAAEGAVWTGAYDFLSQSTDINVNPLKTDIDWTQIAISSTLGGTIGGGIGAVVGGISGRKYLQQEFDYINEAEILAKSGRTSKAAHKAEAEVDNALADLSDNTKAPKQKLSERFIASTVGKTTTALLNLTKASPTLEKYLSYLRYDYDFSLFGKKRAGEKAESFGSAGGRRVGNYLFRLDRGLNELKRTGFLAALTKKENDQLYATLLNPRIRKFQGEAITPEVRQAAKDVRPILNELFDEGKRVGVFTEFQQVLNYVPRRFKWDLVEKNRGRLEQVIIKYGLADPITDREVKKGVTATGKEIDVVLFDQKTVDEEAFGPEIASTWLELYKAGDIKLAQKVKAETIVTNMLETRWTPFELKTKGSVGDSYGFMKHRPFHAIPDEELRPFLETENLEKVLQDYIINASNAITRSEFFGRNLAAFNDNFLQPIRKELMDGGMSANDTQKVLEKITNMHNKVTGIDSQVIKNKYLRPTVEFLKLSQQMAHLPLATLSSITEPILMMARLDAKDVPYAAGQVGKALAKETVKTIDNTIRGIRRGVFRQEVKGKGKHLTDPEWQELYETGLALESSVMERISGMYGDAFQGTAAKGMQNFFFKSTLLTQWTSAVQLASFNVGKRLVQSNAKKLADNKSGKKIISRKIQRYYEEQLEDLGLNVDKTLAWYKKSLKNNEFDRNKSNIQDFYKEDIQQAANRFTKEIILNPSTSEANRPLWFSNPSVNFLVQFAGYPTVFNNTIMKRFVNETKNYPTKVAPKILATSMLMTSVALLGNYVRTVGIAGNKERWDNQSDGLKILDAFRRTGGMAFMDYAVRAESEIERGAGLPSSMVKAVVGPLGQDVIDAFAYRKGFTGIAVDNLPYSAWLPSDVKKKMKAGAREIDKAIGDKIPDIFPDEPKQSKKSTRKRRLPFRKGLEVNVPNAATEPDKAKVRNMNMTYAEMGGILAQDPEDRKGFAEGTQPLTFNQQYHIDTIKQGKVMINEHGQPVTANVIGVEHKGKIYNVPSYNRRGDFYTKEQAKEVFKQDIEQGKIKGYLKEENKYSEEKRNIHLHPANIAAAEEHMMMDDATIPQESIAFNVQEDLQALQAHGKIKAGMERLGFAEGEEVTYGRAADWFWSSVLHFTPIGSINAIGSAFDEIDPKKYPRLAGWADGINKVKGFLSDNVSDPLKELTSTDWGIDREISRQEQRQIDLDKSDVELDEDGEWFAKGKARREERRAKRAGARDLTTDAEIAAREEREAQRKVEMKQRIQAQARARGDAMFQREAEALTGTNSGTEGSRGTRRVMFNQGNLVQIADDLNKTYDSFSAEEEEELRRLVGDRVGFANGTNSGAVRTEEQQVLFDQFVAAGLSFIKPTHTPDEYQAMGMPYTDNPTIAKLIGIESAGDPMALSNTGAKGLMQILESTAREPGYGVTPFQGDDFYNQLENIRFGTDYYNALLKKFGNERDALIGYKQGPTYTSNWLEAGGDVSTLEDEVHDYLNKFYGLGE